MPTPPITSTHQTRSKRSNAALATRPGDEPDRQRHADRAGELADRLVHGAADTESIGGSAWPTTLESCGRHSATPRPVKTIDGR